MKANQKMSLGKNGLVNIS